MFPTTLLSEIRAGDFASATPGLVIALIREHEPLMGVAVGEAGAPPTHLMVDEGGMPTLYPTADVGNPTTLHLGPRSPLLLDIGGGEFDGDRLPHRVGQLCLTQDGLLVCATTGMDNFRRPVQKFVSLTTFQVVEMRQGPPGDARWLATWSLIVRDATDIRLRVLGNPVWPEIARIPR